MLKSIQQRDLDRNRWIKISMTVILVMICVSMVITLIPGLFGGPTTGANNPDAAAVVGGQPITAVDVQRRVNQMSQGQSIPEMMRGLYAQEVLDQMVFQRAMEYEAQRLSMEITPEEERERIQQILPTAFSGGTWLKDQYAQEVQMGTGMSVPDFEAALRSGMLAEKFRQLVTDGITVSPAEIQQEFRRRNEKITIQYALIKPTDLAPTIHPTDDEISAYFKKNIGKYQVPEKRSAQYALLNLAKLRAQTHATDDTLRSYYNDHIADYKVQNSAHVDQILFKTLGKTDAEIAEINEKAQDVDKQAKQKPSGFEDLAKKYSEDDQTKAKGGDLGWIGEGQTAPQVEQAAFSLPKGSVSDVLKTTYGLVIIKVLDRQTAHTKPLEEVRDSILPLILDDQVNDQANKIAAQMAAAIRQSDRQLLADLARKFNLELGDTPPVTVTDAVGPLGSSQDLSRTLFQLRAGELSEPLHIDKGYVIFTPKEILPAHQASLAEVRERVLTDYQQEKSQELARTKANDLQKNVQSGEALDKAAKALGLEAKNSETFARTGSVADIGSANQLESAFSMSVGQVAAPKEAGGNWLVYRVVAHEAANMDDFAKQQQDIKQQLLQTKQNAAFEAFRTALEDRLRKEGKIQMNSDVIQRLTHAG